MYAFGCLLITSSILIFKFKNEYSKNNLEEAEIDAEQASASAQRLSLFNAFKVIYKLFKLRSVRLLTLVFLTMNVIK
jgi:hypothetical protein